MEVGLVTGLGGVRLVEGGLVRPRVDLEQPVARLDCLPLGEEDLDDLAVDPRFDRDRVIGLHRAESADIDRHVDRCDRRHGDRDRCAALDRPGRRGRRQNTQENCPGRTAAAG